MLFANMMVVISVPTKWCENAAIEGVKIANSLIVQKSAKIPITLRVERPCPSLVFMPTTPLLRLPIMREIPR